MNQRDTPFTTPTKPTSPPPSAPASPPPPTRKRHQMRGPEEYPMDELEGTAYHIPSAEFPPEFDLTWVGVDVWGQPQPAIRAAFERKGWEAVHTGDFEGVYDGRFLPRDHAGEIKLNGCLLMARPMSWSKKAKEIAFNNARAQVNIKVNQLRRGELDKVTLDAQHKSALAHNVVTAGMEQVIAPMTTPDK